MDAMSAFSLSGLKQSVGVLVSNVSSRLSKKGTSKPKLTEADFGEILALNDRILQETCADLTDEDIRRYELDPPRVVVVGLTSAGKSSLLERVIGFPIFPVLDSVCTRQPFQVALRRRAAAMRARRAAEAKGEAKSKADGVGADAKSASNATVSASGPPAAGQSSSSSAAGPTTDQSHSDVPDDNKTAILRLPSVGKEFRLPDETAAVRSQIAAMQQSDSKSVKFSKSEIRSTVTSDSFESFTFTDLPGVFMVSEMKMGQSFAKSRAENARLQRETMQIAKHYVQKPNTIVLLVVSAIDWMHGMNNDPLCGHLAEWLEETRKTHAVDVYGVITKLDMVSSLSPNSPIRKVFAGGLDEGHILSGLNVKKWIPVVSSPQVLAQRNGALASAQERSEVLNALKGSVSATTLDSLPIGRDALLRELKLALLKAITKTQAGLRERLGKFGLDLDRRLSRLPRPATVSEKRQTFDQRLKVLEQQLQSLVGGNGRCSSDDLRMRLMVHAPKAFEQALNQVRFRGDSKRDVQQILNQAALEAGGSFDSDMSFNNLSLKIIESYRKPCLDLVSRCATIILRALKRSVDTAFGDYKLLRGLIMRTIGLPVGDDVSGPAETPVSSAPPKTMFAFLRRSALSKVESLLEAHRTMICFHPMWRNFDTLYWKILQKDDAKQQRGEAHARRGAIPSSAEDTLQRMLDLPALAKRVREEGITSIKSYERATGEKIPEKNAEKVRKHFARVEVMGYIIRMSLLGTVFPMILRDLRDGLFDGVKCGIASWDFSVSRLLRTKILFDPAVERKLCAYMDPSPEDTAKRVKLERKRKVVSSLAGEFAKCQDKLQALQDMLSP